jgi:hypothetical protein
VLLCGGSVWSDLDTAYVPANHLWQFDITSGSWSNITQPAEQSPPACYSPAFEYVGNNLVVYAGERSWGEIETWIFNTASNQWTNVTSQSSSKPSRYGTSAYIGEAKIIMYLSDRFSGSTETWQFNAADYSWKNLSTSQSIDPPSRADHRMTYGGNGKAILFGGRVYGLGLWNDTWQYYAGDLENQAYY